MDSGIGAEGDHAEFAEREISRRMIHVRIDLEDLTGFWRITRITVKRDATEHRVTSGEDQFKNKAQALSAARMRARWFLMKNFGKVPEGEIVWDVWPPAPSEGIPLG